MLTNLDKELASGLKTTAMVEYHPDKDEDTFDQLLILVGTKTIVVPLMGYVTFMIHTDICNISNNIRIKVIYIFSFICSFLVTEFKWFKNYCSVCNKCKPCSLFI